MGLIKDIKSDTYKKKTLKVLLYFFISFFILDFFISIVLENGLEKYYGLDSEAKIALIGHSHLMLGVDKMKMEDALGCKVAKYTSEGVNVSNRKLMIEHLLNKNPNVETIIYGVDAWTFTGEGLSENSHILFYPFLDDVAINKMIKKTAPKSEYLTRKVIKSTRYNEGLIASSIRGYLKKWDNLKFGTVNVQKLNNQIKNGKFRKINTTVENISILLETIQLLQDKQIKVILLYLPTIDSINKVEKEKFENTLQIFRDLENEYNNVEFVNYLEPFSHQHDLFFDPIHLNPKGQSIVTEKLITYLNKNGNE